jgi:hypothetical protein
MSLLSQLVNLLHSNQQARPFPEHGPVFQPKQYQDIQLEPLRPRLSPGDPGLQGYLPDTGYNPNPNTNIPWSVHSWALAQMANRVMQNPNLQAGRNQIQGGTHAPAAQQSYRLQPGAEDSPQVNPQAPLGINNRPNTQQIRF